MADQANLNTIMSQALTAVLLVVVLGWTMKIVGRELGYGGSERVKTLAKARPALWLPRSASTPALSNTLPGALPTTPQSSAICRILGMRIGKTIKVTDEPAPVSAPPIKVPVREPVLVPAKRSSSVFGYRVWNVGIVGDQPLLVSPFGGYIWSPGINAAACDEDKLVEHLSKDRHGCGFYGLKEFYTPPTKLPGRVVMWGKTVEAEYGYRAQYAQVDAIATPLCDLCEKLATIVITVAWGVPMEDVKFCCDQCREVLKRSLGLHLPPQAIRERNLSHIMGLLSSYYSAQWVEWPITAADLPGPILDIKTGARYSSKVAAARAVAGEYDLDPQDHWAWYRIASIDPTRFKVFGE